MLATAAPPAAAAAAATTASNVSLVAAAAAIFMCSFGGRNEARYHPHVNPYIFIEIRTRKDTLRRSRSSHEKKDFVVSMTNFRRE